MDAKKADRSTRQGRLGRFNKWPLVGKLAVALTVAAVVATVYDFAIAMESGATLKLALIPVVLFVLAGYCWALAIASYGERITRSGRTFPLSRGFWFVRPPRHAWLRAADPAHKHLVPIAIIYLPFALVLAIIRVLELTFFGGPHRDDIVCIKNIDGERGYSVAEVVHSNPATVRVRVLQSNRHRVRGVRLEECDTDGELIELRRVVYDSLRPRLLWRGERRFWATARKREATLGAVPAGA
jgi:hypothetical protein